MRLWKISINQSKKNLMATFVDIAMWVEPMVG